MVGDINHKNYSYSTLAGKQTYFSNSHKQNYSPTIDKVLQSLNKNDRIIDPSSILSILVKSYIIGTGTLVNDIKVNPWMSVLDCNNNWEPLALPRHANDIMSGVDIAKQFKELLIKEALAFLKNKTTVGLLLSGGMDSRVVAGILKELQMTNQYNGTVVCLNWGIPLSRDVMYAKRIAEQFNWEYKHFDLNRDVLKENIELAAMRGAEYSPIHLHAMKGISKITGLDGIIAGSYGDSIGRGEYSGKKVGSLPYILDKRYINQYSILLQSATNASFNELNKIVFHHRELFPNRKESDYREIELQMHYMRRHLQSCMGVISDNIPFYQMFSDPNVFGFIWGLNNDIRNNDIYMHLLNDLPGNLINIPWARNGEIYNQKDPERHDDYFPHNNKYGHWLRTDLREFVIENIMNGHLQKLGIFNVDALEMWVKWWPKSASPKADRIDEKMAWLASLSIFIKLYDIKPYSKVFICTLNDRLNLTWSFFMYQLYRFAKCILRKIKK